MRHVLRLLNLVRGYWRYIAQSAMVSLLLIGLQIPTPYLTKILMDRVYPDRDVTLLGFVVLAQLALTLFSASIASVRDYFQLHVGLEMGIGVGLRFLRHLESLSFSFYDRRKTGDIMSRFTDVSAATSAAIGMFVSLFLSSVQLLVFPAVLLLISWKLTLISLVAYPFDMFLYRQMNRRLLARGREVARGKADLQSKLFESLSGIRTIQSLCIEERVSSDIHRSLEELAGRQLGVGRVNLIGGLAGGASGAISALLLTWFGWRFVLSGELSLGALMAFVMYSGYLSGPLRSLFQLSTTLQQTRIQAERFFEIFDEPPAIRDESVLQAGDPPPDHEIRMEHVSFCYDGCRPVLHSVNVVMRARQMTAIVGRSGSGKTTLVSLIPRFHDPSEGRVLMGGRDLREYPLAALRSKVGFVMQRNSFFGGSIAEEVALGNGRLSSGAIRAAAQRAHLDEFICNLPRGYDTPLSEFATNMSEGQRQRLALARVFATKRPVLILDEPTSSLDDESEEYVRGSLEELRRTHTIVVIAHRLSTIERADWVVVLNNGTVSEEGTFDELVARKGELHRLYRSLARI